jgi:hypothetical protein
MILHLILAGGLFMETTTEATALVAAANRRNGTRHEVRCVGKRQIAATLETSVSAGAPQVFNFVVAEDVLPKVLTGYGLLPAVVGTSGNTGQWDRPGSVRTVHLADGTTAREEVTDYESGRYFAYRTSDYTFALRHLAAFAEGQWWFKPDANGTAVRWTYTFQAKNWLTSILLRLFVRTQWVGYMRTCIVHVQGHFAR